MSAPVKSMGGRSKQPAAIKLAGGNSPSQGEIPPLSSAASARSSAERPPRGRSAGGSAQSKLPKPPQGHSGYERKLPRREGTAPRYTNQSVKGQMLEAAIAAASERGYESMRISEITDPVGVTRQAFYAHFRDKRHCMCEAIEPRLGAIERMAASLSESDPGAASKLALALDDLIAERFGSQEGTRGRIVGAMISLLREQGTFHKVRIGALVKAAHVPPGDFYRQFSGKGECFAVAYAQLLGELVSEVREAVAAQPPGGSVEPRHEVLECSAEHTRHDVPTLLSSLAAALDGDPERRRILIVEAAHLPDKAPPDINGARKSALTDAVAELLAGSAASAPADARLAFAAAAVVEVVRSAEIVGGGEALEGGLAGPAASLGRVLHPRSESAERPAA